MAGLVAAAVGLPVALLPEPAAATDDGEDLSDLLVDEVDGYELQPRGDPLRGRSGPLDWDELGPLAGADPGALPDDRPGYVNSFVADDYGTFALVMGVGLGELDPSEAVAGAGAGMGQPGGSEELVLPDADQAGVEYEARHVVMPGGPDDESYSAAALAEEDEDMVVIVVVTSFAGGPAHDHAVLDRFVTAQAAFEPPADQTPADDRIGSNGQNGTNERNESATDDAGSTGPSGSPQRVDDGGGGPTAERVGLATLWVVFMAGLGLLVWYFGHARRARTATTGWTQVPGGGGAAPRWSPGGGRHPPAPPPASPSSVSPPLPPAATPPLALAVQPIRPVRRPPPPPPVAPPPIPFGGLRTQRREAPVQAPLSQPPDPPAPDPLPGSRDGDGDGWRLPG